MKKSVLLVLTVLLLLVWWFYIFDAYLCSHLYYGWDAFTSCSWGQGKGLDLLWKWANWSLVLWAVVTSLLPVWYMYFSKKISLIWLMWLFVWWIIAYVIWFTMMKDALLSPGAIILIFNLLAVCAVIGFFIISITVLWNFIFKKLHWRTQDSMHDVFLQFTLGLIGFCITNIILLMLGVYYAAIVWLQIGLLIYLLWKQKSFLKHLYKTTEDFVQNMHNVLHKLPWVSILYYLLIIVTCVYIYMWMNLAYIPYPTAWDANHAYIFIPRAWAIHNWLYWWVSWASHMPYLWYWFLTFWFKFAQSFPIWQWFFGISPDSLTVLMNFLSGPLVLLASWFLLHAFIEYLQDKKWDQKHSLSYSMTILCVWRFLMLLWLTSGMWAFLVFVDNKTDLAVMFFGVIALYVWIQFIRILSQKNSNIEGINHKTVVQYAIIAGLFFAASILAKPTGMFDMIHFAVLFLMQWQVVLFGVWAYIAILGFLWKTQMLLIYQFITPIQSTYLMIVGLILTIIGIVMWLKKYSYRHYMRYFLIWVATIVTTLVIYKWPYSVIQQRKANGTVNIEQSLRTIILGQNTQVKTQSRSHILLASNIGIETLNAIDANTETWSITVQKNVTPTREQCLQQPSDTDTLYKNTKKVPSDGGSEDLGRYIGYWWKSFSSLSITSFLPAGCYSIYTDAQYLCMNYATLQKWDVAVITKILSGAPQNNRVVDWKNQLELSKNDAFATQTTIKKITTYVESNAILKQDNITYIPYKLLVPFNVTFNWSLQNLSSYYTDVGIMWLIGLWLVILWLLYWILLRKKPLVIISVITLGAWATWWVIASAIIWYSLWLIVWTILGTVAYFYYIFQDRSKKSLWDTVALYGIAWLFILWSILQLIFNLIRIASQGGSGPFVRYKANVWQITILDEQLSWQPKNTVGYWAKDIFNLQFPHYNKFLSAVNQRQDWEWVVIAGTYAQYFIDNQRNVQPDWFLTQFWETSSDNNVCNTYLRLRDKKTKYIAIDPNIASVVMGWWNSTLLDRFFWVVSADNSLVQYGTLTMLQALVQNKYLTLLSTNNIVTKYAFVISDEQLSALLNVPVGEKLLVERAKMSSARYFPNAQTYATISSELFVKRIQTYDAIQDIADILGKDIRTNETVAVAKRILAGIKQEDTEAVKALIQALSNDEKFVLQQFISLAQAKDQNPTQFRQYVIGLIWQSVNNGSQIIVFTVE